MKVAALDLGTNTFLCLIAEVKNQRVESVIADQVEMVRLGQEIGKAGRFHQEALARAEKALEIFSRLIEKHRTDKVLAMATSAARDVANGEELLDLCRRFSIPVQIIGGSREAELTFFGALSNQTSDEKARMVIDVGGGSTEYIYGVGGKISWARSLDIGCVRLRERWITSPKIDADIRQKIEKDIQKAFADLQAFKASPAPEEIVAVAGTPTELARMELSRGKSGPVTFQRDAIEGFTLSEEQLSRWLDELGRRTAEEISTDFAVHPGRADVLWVGVAILRESLRFWGKEALRVSTRGVRYGVALELAR